MIEQHKPSAAVSQLHALELPPEEPIDVGRYANALRRSKLLIVAIVVVVTGLVLAVSLAPPEDLQRHRRRSSSTKARASRRHDRRRAPAGDDPEAPRHARRARARRAAPAGRVRRVAHREGPGRGRPDGEHRHDHRLGLDTGACGPHRERRHSCVPRAASERSSMREIQSAETRLKAAIVGLKGTPGGEATDRAHPRAAERAVRERGDRRVGAPARGRSASADERRLRRVPSETPPSRSSPRSSSPCSWHSVANGSRRESESRASSSG